MSDAALSAPNTDHNKKGAKWRLLFIFAANGQTR